MKEGSINISDPVLLGAVRYSQLVLDAGLGLELLEVSGEVLSAIGRPQNFKAW